jgi:hypothetical protein
MLLVVGSARDVEARTAVDQFGPDHAVLLDAADLSRPGWRLSLKAPRTGAAIASGRLLPVEAISGVLVRRLAVYPQELPHVHADDRPYVAAEMTALLAWWLRALDLPVLNRPSAGGLCGPAWRTEHWRDVAARQQIPAAPVNRSSIGPRSVASPTTEVVVVGTTIIGEAPVGLQTHARRLAAAAGVTLFRAWFDTDGVLLGADCFPRLTPAVVGAIGAMVGLP